MVNKKIVAVLITAGALAAAGPASAHGRGGAIVGALIGGAVLGAIVSSAVAPAPVYAAPAYQPVYQPVYQQPAQYQYQQAYAGPPPGTCYDGYRNAYVACGPQPAPGYYQQPGW